MFNEKLKVHINLKFLSRTREYQSREQTTTNYTHWSKRKK